MDAVLYDFSNPDHNKKYSNFMELKTNLPFHCFDEKVFSEGLPSDVYLPNFYFYNEYKLIADEITINLHIDVINLINKECQKISVRYDKAGLSSGIYIDYSRKLSSKEIVYCVASDTEGGQEVYTVRIFGIGLNYEIFAEKFQRYILSENKKEFKIGLIRSTQFGLDIGWFGITRPKVDIELNYGKEFAETHYPIILEKLKTVNKGIYLLESEPGAGKSFLIKHLASQVENRKFIYLAENIISSGLDNPSLIDLLIENKNCVLIIEDAEKFIVSREQDSQSLVSNLLNITDGILSDLLGFSLIITHNMKNVGDIDDAIKRAGRLQYQYKFGRLNIEDSQKKIDSLGFSYKVTKPMTLAEIYNVQEKLGDVTKKEEKVIGFGAK